MYNLASNELHYRDLDKCYFLIMTFKTTIPIMKEGEIKKQEIYLFYGCNLQGVRKFIDYFFVSEYTKTSDWYNFLLNLKKRNLEVVLYASIYDNKALKDALLLAFSDIKIYKSYYDVYSVLSKYFNERYSVTSLNIIRNMYVSETIDDYNNYVNLFMEEYSSSQFIIDILEKKIRDVKVYYDIEYIIRKHIVSFYFVRDNERRIRLLSKSKSYFNNINDFLEPLIPLISRMETRTYCPKKEWNLLANTLYLQNKELLKCYF